MKKKPDSLTVDIARRMRDLYGGNWIVAHAESACEVDLAMVTQGVAVMGATAEAILTRMVEVVDAHPECADCPSCSGARRMGAAALAAIAKASGQVQQ